MDDLNALNRRYEAVAWGILFIWIGIAWLIPGDANGIGWLGIGVILIGLNVVRRLHHIPMNWFSNALGVIALVIGVTKQILDLLGKHIVLPLFPVLFIVIGVLFLVSVFTRREVPAQP
jgi:hypothetical protein